ncbi:MAG: hypothetical protein EXS37_02985 [Opitutus sp.]|nr:hypothetical protein [Opitutus sp.]
MFRHLLGLPSFTLIALTLRAEPAMSRPEVVLGATPLLFADDGGVSRREGVVRTIHAARTRELPVLEPEKPWEGSRIYVYGSVYRDTKTGGYRMWYLGRPQLEGGEARNRAPGLRGGGADPVMYATSADGLNWIRPTLGLYAFDGTRENNIVFELHSPSVLLDRREKDPEKRYKMLGSTLKGYHAAHSSDGLHWVGYPHNPVLDYFDTITLCQDPRTGEYLAFHKRPAVIRGFGRRVVWLARSRDFQTWSAPELVFAPDATDDEWATRAGERTEVYNMSVYPHAAGFIGLPTMFRLMTTRSNASLTPGQSPVDGPIDVQLVTSPDAREWHRTWPRQNVISRGPPGSFDAGAILGLSSTVVHSDTESWVYYTGLTTGHGGPLPAKRLSIGRAEWRLHGFASLDAVAGPDGGQVETVPLRLRSSRLVVNADASRGELRVTILSADGKPLAADAIESGAILNTDALHWVVRLRDSAMAAGGLRVRIAMKNARLFSLVSPEEDSPSH